MIFDTDVIIWCLRGRKAAAIAIKAEQDRKLSVISFMELLQGARSKRDQLEIRQFLDDYRFELLPISANISQRACVYVEEYALRDGLHVTDALIAATAVEHGEILLSGNHRHYRVVEGLDLKVFEAGTA